MRQAFCLSANRQNVCLTFLRPARTYGFRNILQENTAMHSATLSDRQARSLVERLIASGMTGEDADWFIRNDVATYEMLVSGRERTCGKRRPEEYRLHEMSKGRYCGIKEALVYFGTRLRQIGLSSHKNHCATLVSQLEMMSQNAQEAILIVWMPPLSLYEISNILPHGYFPKYTRWYQNLMELGASHQKMDAGLRLFRRCEVAVEKSHCPSLTETVYLNAVFHLTGQKFLYHNQIRCLHGRQSTWSSEYQRCTFRGWSADTNDYLGFDISENYSHLEKDRPATHFSCERYGIIS